MAVVINTLYRVSVDLDERAYQIYGDTSDYDHAWIAATEGSLDAELNHYSRPSITADFWTMSEAVKCKEALIKFDRDYTAMARVYDEQNP